MWVDCIYYEKGCCSEPNVIGKQLHYPTCNPRLCGRQTPLSIIIDAFYGKDDKDEVRYKEFDYWFSDI